jgi:predicted GH43/DUF377 family glycosyl hydrolase
VSASRVLAPHDLFRRHPANPILTAGDWPVRVNTVFNPGVCTQLGDTVLVCRVEDLRGISHLWVARSTDGVGGWKIDAKPLLTPNEFVEAEQWGFEDPRVVYIEEIGRWVITCTAYGPLGPAVYMATTDFRTVERHGLMMPPEDKNAALFSRRIHGDWALVHRPATLHSATRGIWLSRSRDLEAWRHPERVMRSREGSWWDSSRLGIGPPPMETSDGWLLIYHGVRNGVNGDVYRVGLAMLDLDDPTRVMHRSEDWVFGPEAPYERIGDVPNVVFPCGTTYDADTDTIKLYYGAADTSVALATADRSEVLDYLRSCPPDLDGSA